MTHRSKVLLLCLAVASLGAAAPAAAKGKADWSCGSWTKKETGKCSETRTCTRTICDTSGPTIGKCRKETKTECVLRDPKKPSSALGYWQSQYPFLNGELKNDPGPAQPAGRQIRAPYGQPIDPGMTKVDPGPASPPAQKFPTGAALANQPFTPHSIRR